MKNKLNFKNKKNSTKAFTLIQLVIVIAILGILAGIAIPHFMTANTVAKEKTCYTNRVRIARAYAIFEVKGSDVSLGDFLKGVATEDGEYMQYFKSPPICPSGGTYSASNGKILCSIPSHNVDKVSLGEGRDYSNSIGGNILQSFVDFAKIHPELSGSDLLYAWFDEYDLDYPIIGNADKVITFYDGSTNSRSNYGVSIYLADGADASEAIVYIAANATSNKLNANFVYDPENDTWYKYKLTSVSSDSSDTIDAGSLRFSLTGLTYSDVKELIDTDTAFADDTGYETSTDSRKSTALWASESDTATVDSPALNIDFASNMDSWLKYN